MKCALVFIVATVLFSAVALTASEAPPDWVTQNTISQSHPPIHPWTKTGQAGASSAFGIQVETQETLDGFIFRVFWQVAEWQRDLHRQLARSILRSKDNGSASAVWVLLAGAFAYGVLHAAGPGHGKLIVASYFSARPNSLRSGVILGTLIALTQSIVAILIVWISAVVLGATQSQVMAHVDIIEIASYGAIALLGIYMTIRSIAGKESCAHHDIPLPSSATRRFKCAAVDDAYSPTNECCDDPLHNHTPASMGESTIVSNLKQGLQILLSKTLGEKGEMIALGIGAGLRPCSGSVIVLLFGLANSSFALGIGASLAIAAGVGVTISALGIGVIALRRAATEKLLFQSPFHTFAHRALSILGSLSVFLLGALLLGGGLVGNGIFPF